MFEDGVTATNTPEHCSTVCPWDNKYHCKEKSEDLKIHKTGYIRIYAYLSLFCTYQVKLKP